MDCDGTKKGYDIEIYQKLANMINIPVIASGGAGGVEHMHEVLKIGNADAVLAASIFHFKELTVSDIKQQLNDKGVNIRL